MKKEGLKPRLLQHWNWRTSTFSLCATLEPPMALGTAFTLVSPILPPFCIRTSAITNTLLRHKEGQFSNCLFLRALELYSSSWKSVQITYNTTKKRSDKLRPDTDLFSSNVSAWRRHLCDLGLAKIKGHRDVILHTKVHTKLYLILKYKQ